MSKNRTSGIVLSIIVIATLMIAMNAGRAAKASDRYLALVRRNADYMIEHGRDTYGSEHSPLFAAALNPATGQVFEKMPPSLSGLRNGDRVFDGANPMLDLNFYQVLYALSEITSEPKYAAEADVALKWFCENCQSPKGLFAWGEHQGWNFRSESPSKPEGPHEFFRPWVLSDRTSQLAPEAFGCFATGLWEHQIGDHKKGLFSRHAMEIWDLNKKSSRTGYEFPRHGGFFIAIWASDYERSKNPIMLEAIEALVDGFESRRNPKSGAIPSQTSKPELVWPQSNLSLAIDLWDSAPKVPATLGEKMRQCARRIDETFHKISHEPGEQGFVTAAYSSTLEPGDVRADEAGGSKGLRWQTHAATWATGYGAPTNASIAMVTWLRYQQIQDPRYRELVIAAADVYLDTDPRIEPYVDEQGNKVTPVIYPAALASTIALQLAAYRATNESIYLDRADHFAEIAVDLFFDGDAPLPRVGSRPNMVWYEALTRADNLVMQLLDLWAVKNRPELNLKLTWTER